MSKSEHVVPKEQMDYWNVFREMPLPCMLFRADAPRFTVVDVNRAREELTGTPRSQMVGRPLDKVAPITFDRFHESGTSNMIDEAIREVIRTGTSKSFTLPSIELPRHSGKTTRVRLHRSYIPLKDSDDKVTHVMAVTQDITSRLGEAQRAAEVESRLEAAMAIGSVGSWVWYMDSDKIVVDATMAKLFGVSQAQAAKGVSRQVMRNALYKDDVDRVTKAMERAIRNKSLFEEEYRLVDHKGKLHWVIARARLTQDAEGKQTFSGVILDITERRDLQAQIELAHQQDRLNRQVAKSLQERNEELEAIARTKDEFVALASHQLRTPATAVKQYIGMVLQGYVGRITATQKDMLNKAFESNERQIQIINQILNAARVDTGRLIMTSIKVDLRTLVQGIATDMQPDFKQHGHSFTCALPKRPILTMADLGYLRMAIENVLHNAAIYTPDGGAVSMQLAKSGKQAILKITDSGVGIRKSDMDKLFAKFSRIHNPLSVQAGGSGIGLFLAAEIVRLHGGNVTVDSKLHKGSTFAISLPLVQNNS